MRHCHIQYSIHIANKIKLTAARVCRETFTNIFYRQMPSNCAIPMLTVRQMAMNNNNNNSKKKKKSKIINGQRWQIIYYFLLAINLWRSNHLFKIVLYENLPLTYFLWWSLCTWLCMCARESATTTTTRIPDTNNVNLIRNRSVCVCSSEAVRKCVHSNWTIGHGLDIGYLCWLSSKTRFSILFML